ncbi:hypothetical protein [Lacipirellula parvula]|uniref:Cytochrome c domain-containing protein n=1 Tax=Lacipirellula parvula TaxID=2650471 RepID=A0A5K7X5G6_9BACT|nr:hypothetical protein [Lacipirellula parvula]BBO31057.1 hypothetical protein PLANPX_0669 [Lacipirellula parvula]
MRFVQSVMLWVFLAEMAVANDGAAALEDRLSSPPTAQPFLYYVTTSSAIDELERKHQEYALKLVVPHLSRQTVLERCLPVQVGPTLWRLNLADLQWSLDNWRHIIASYPYHRTGSRHPLVVRADWLLLTITDASASDAYYRLLLGRRPKNRQEVFLKLGVIDDPQYQYGQIAGGSRVSKSGIRFVRSLPVLRGWSYLTEDAFKIAGDRDPLQFPIGKYPHDGEELLVASPKLHMATGVRGVTMVGFLFDGKGNTVDKADTALVEDYSKTRGFAHIVAGLSCFSCHQSGPNGPSQNVLKRIIASGAEADVYRYQDQEAIEAFHFTDLGKQMRRESNDYRAIVRQATGVESEDAVEALRSTLNSYDADVTLERAAIELDFAVSELRRAVAWMDSKDYQISGWFAAMTHAPQNTIPREAFEEQYNTLRSACDAWRKSQ